MKINFNSECDYIRESILLMERYYNQADFIDLKEHLKKKSGYTKRIEKVLTKMDIIYKEILARVTMPEDIKDCFIPLQEGEETDNSLAVFILSGSSQYSEMSLKESREMLRKNFRENPESFMSLVSFQLEENKFMDENEFMQAIQDMPTIDDGMKWKIWHVYKNYDLYLDKLMDQIDLIAPVIMEIYQKYQEDFSDFIQYWEEKSRDTHSFIEAFTQHVKFSFKEGTGIYVRPSYLGCNGLRLNVLNEESFYISIGWMFKDEDIVNSRGVTTEELCRRLKLLSDPSKYEILKLIKNKGLYGSQLAEKINLTTATISHHVSTLSNASLISYEKDANRIYYHLNKEQIGFLLDRIRSDLYED